MLFTAQVVSSTTKYDGVVVAERAHDALFIPWLGLCVCVCVGVSMVGVCVCSQAEF